MKNTKQAIALASAAALSVGMLAGCGGAASSAATASSEGTSTATAEASTTAASDGTLVLAETGFESKFSPFFAASASDQDVIDLTQIALLGADRKGEMVLNGIEGETREYNGTDYTYHGPADCVVTENADGTVTYDIKLREDLKFSDGEPITIDDVIFSMYVLCDPTYDGNSTLFALPIEGMDAYRSGMDTLYNLMLAAGRDNTDFSKWKEADQTAFWADVDQAGVKFVQDIMQYCIAEGTNAEGDSVAACMKNWGYDLPADATEADAFNAILAKYDTLTEAVDTEKANATFTSLLNDYETKYTKGIETGTSAANISGIKKTGDYSMTVSLTQVDATAIYQLGVTIAPMHYYGETDKYDYDNNMFGFVKGDLSHVKSVTSTPIGSGPYTFESWSNGAVTLQKNPTYWKGEPKIDTVIWREMTDEDKIPGVVSGTIDVTDPSYSKEAAEQIKEANSNGEISGDTIQTDLVANLGYGYVGFNANRVKVGDGNGGDEASKDLRKAIATVIAVYRDVAVDSYYGEFANVINYPISDTSWAAPRVTDEGYKVAFSVDVNGNDIYTEGMSADDKYAAAKQAALGYFEAAGYTVADGKITAAPAGGRMDAEVMVGGSGKGDHPSFMALTLASDALKEIGFNLIVSDMSNFAEMTNAINAGTADMFAMAWQATPDPDMFQIYHSKGGSNEKSYWIKDADLDELIMMARQSTDQTYRKTLYKQCLDIVADWAVEIPIYQRQNCVIFSAKRVNLDTVTPDITTYWTWYNDIELLDLQ